MIAAIEGKLLRLDTEAALLQVGPLTYEVMLPGYCVNTLADKIGTSITLCTMEYYEGTPAGGNLIPRLVGFLNEGERDFFTRFIRVKGMGTRKALRCLSVPVATIADAIENADEKTLTALPQIGRKMAQHIIAELKGQLASFAIGAQVRRPAEKQLKPFQTEALEILIAWGEKTTDAIDLIQLACEKHPDINLAEDLVPLVYRLKQGIEV